MVYVTTRETHTQKKTTTTYYSRIYHRTKVNVYSLLPFIFHDAQFVLF